MPADLKAQWERQTFDRVYGGRTLNDVKGNGDKFPDFLVQCFPNSPYFGVEVTDFYHSETSVRLGRKPGYSGRLLDGHDIEDKVDRTTLSVGEVDVLREDNSVHASGVRAIIQKLPSPCECARQVAERIGQKANRMRASMTDLSHVNLIIHDRTEVLRLIRKSDFYRTYFVPELVAAISEAPFREVYFVTVAEGEQLYICLKMLYLLAEIHYFNSVVMDQGLVEQIPPDVDELELFASFLQATVKSTVLVHRDTAGTEVILGDSGIVIAKDNSVVVRLHFDHPISSNAAPPTVQWQTILGAKFFEVMNTYRKLHTFSTEAFFSIHKADAHMLTGK